MYITRRITRFQEIDISRSVRLWNGIRYSNIQRHDLIMDCKRIMEVLRGFRGLSSGKQSEFKAADFQSDDIIGFLEVMQ